MDSESVYRPRRAPRHERVRARGLEMHLTRWGPAPSAAEPPIFLLHGWLDSGATFQFLVDAFLRDYPIVALDWRGFGHSQWPQEGYGFPDYLGDLDALLDLLSPVYPVKLLGHSMGGNIANLYAGLRPERVKCVVNLEGFGLPRTTSGDSPRRLRKWLDQIKTPVTEKRYHSLEQFAAVIQFRYPRFSPETVQFVARIWGAVDEEGRVKQASDPRHHWVNPNLYKREDAEATWQEIRAPMLMILGAESDYLPRLGPDGTLEALRSTFPGVQIQSIPDAGHMLHIERPASVAPHIEAFLEAH